MRKFLNAAAVLTLLLVLGSCRKEPTGASGPSWMRASLSGAVEAQFEGTGHFAPLRDYAASPRYLKISAEQEAGPSASESAWIYFRSNTPARPGPGSYPLVPHETRFGSSRGWTAVYGGEYTSGGVRASGIFVAQQGTLTVTKSTSDVLEGTFRFTGIQIATNAPRNAPDPDAPTTEVTGSFHLTFFDESAQVGYGL